jgi:hypothetical protein
VRHIWAVQEPVLRSADQTLQPLKKKAPVKTEVEKTEAGLLIFVVTRKVDWFDRGKE